MSVYELSRVDAEEGFVDLGMTVIGLGIDKTFRPATEAPKEGEELLKDAVLDDLLDPEAIRVAAEATNDRLKIAAVSGDLAAATSLLVIDAA